MNTAFEKPRDGVVCLTKDLSKDHPYPILHLILINVTYVIKLVTQNSYASTRRGKSLDNSTIPFNYTHIWIHFSKELI